VTCRPEPGICHEPLFTAWCVVHTLHNRRVGLLLHRALHTLGMTAMFNSPHPSTRPRDLRRRQLESEASESRGGRHLSQSSVPSASLHAQLDALLYARWLPGRWVQRVWMLSDLPLRLEQRALSISSDSIWRAYTDGARLWFAVAAAAVSTYGRSAVALEVLFFEDDGALCSGGLWRCHPNGDWGLERRFGTSAEARFD
jgi:hypothetical protein